MAVGNKILDQTVFNHTNYPLAVVQRLKMCSHHFLPWSFIVGFEYHPTRYIIISYNQFLSLCAAHKYA